MTFNLTVSCIAHVRYYQRDVRYRNSLFLFFSQKKQDASNINLIYVGLTQHCGVQEKRPLVLKWCNIQTENSCCWFQFFQWPY